jgi:hypothetical protein
MRGGIQTTGYVTWENKVNRDGNLTSLLPPCLADKLNHMQYERMCVLDGVCLPKTLYSGV